MKTLPLRRVHPYLCPFCGELAFPHKGRPPILLPDKCMRMWVCPNNHEFYTYERVCAHQEWAYNVFNGIEQPIWRRKSERWLKQLQRDNFGLDDYVEPSE